MIRTEEKPFFISIEPTEKEKKIEEIVERAFQKLEEIGSVEIPRAYVGSYWKEGNFGSVKWYVKKAYNPWRKQVDFDKLWRLIQQEPWQQLRPHHDLMILATDLYVGDTNFIFGCTIPRVRSDGSIREVICGSVISVNRIQRYKNWEDSFLTILLHELGHLYGVPSSSSPDYIFVGDKKAKSLLDFGHCNNRKCVMEQINTDGRLDLPEKAEYLKRYNPDYYCIYDLKTLRRNLERLYSKASYIL